ncbi:DoxX family membrane protein [Saprospiraceae bacterium]|nr:DoxX family membrane protein [Bacteroidota bacterium]MDB4728548.1 DoxX family membrane protein [Saprospiraceae bacterium]MDF1866618.1 DoxX family membrane protein [Saprospiraceae bacterium]
MPNQPVANHQSVNNILKDIADLIARLCLAFIFLYEAYDSLVYFKATKAKMIEYGLTWNSEFLLVSGIILLILGGIMLLSGYRSGLGVTLLLMYWIPVTFIVHDFWNIDRDCNFEVTCLSWVDEYRRIQGIMFMKNIAIMGGLLMVWVNGSGRYSIKRLFATTKVPKKWRT